MRVLLVEDDAAVARSVSFMLKNNGAVIDATDTAEEAFELAKLYDYDVVILDLLLPDGDGYEVVRRLRANRLHVPVLVLSGLSRPDAKLKAFGIGADDYLAKPFDNDELMARLKAIVRRANGFSQPVLSVGPLQLNTETHDVAVNGRPVHLTGKEYSILELLILRRNMVLTKEVFLNHIYGGMDEPEGKIIDVFICKLRKKFLLAGAPDVIGTVWGRGYTLCNPAANSDHPNGPYPLEARELQGLTGV